LSDTPLTPQRLRELLDHIRGVSVAVFGDFCLDSYWTVDPKLSEISIETGKPTTPVRQVRCSLGGADIVAPDFSQPEVFMRALTLEG
jgi:bifunctional ADP-heptose synthase (sugar kinase/adenylyltransferase)